MFLRFVCKGIDSDANTLSGIFQRAFKLIDDGVTPGYVIESIRDEVEWFQLNVAVPDCFDSAQPHPLIDRAICWFKDSAREPVQRCWTLTSLFEIAGVHVDFIRSKNPGAIIWQDKIQVVSLPWRQHRDGKYRV